MNRREFIKVAAAGFGTLLVSGIGYSMLTKKGGNNPAAPTQADAAPTPGSGTGKKIVVITGSPHRNGTSALLADKFIEGAKSAGNEVFRFNAAFEDIHPCRGCNTCRGNGMCVLNDAIEKSLMPKLLEADVIVLVNPLYYYGFSAQLKTVIDRFYSHMRAFDGKSSLLLTTAWNSSGDTFKALMDHYDSLRAYMKWQDLGVVLGYGCGYRSAIETSQYPGEALELGKSIKA